MTEFPESSFYICNPKLNTACVACVNGECCSSYCYATTEAQYAHTNNNGEPYLIAHSQDDYKQLTEYGDKVFSKVTGAAYVVVHEDSEDHPGKVILLDLSNLQKITVTLDHFHAYYE